MKIVNSLGDSSKQPSKSAAALMQRISHQAVKKEPEEVIVAAEGPTYTRTPKRARKHKLLQHYKRGDRLLDTAIVATVLSYEPPEPESRKTKSSKLLVRLDDGVVLTITALKSETSAQLMKFALITKRIELQKLVCGASAKSWVFNAESLAFFHPQKEHFRPPTFDAQGRIRRIKHLAFFSNANVQLLTDFCKFEPRFSPTARYTGGSIQQSSIFGRAAVRDQNNNRAMVSICWDESLRRFRAGIAIDVLIGSCTLKEKQVTLHTIAEYVQPSPNNEFLPKGSSSWASTGIRSARADNIHAIPIQCLCLWLQSPHCQTERLQCFVKPSKQYFPDRAIHLSETIILTHSYLYHSSTLSLLPCIYFEVE